MARLFENSYILYILYIFINMERTPHNDVRCPFCADDQNRTGDLLTTNEVLYRLSHISLSQHQRILSRLNNISQCHKKLYSDTIVFTVRSGLFARTKFGTYREKMMERRKNRFFMRYIPVIMAVMLCTAGCGRADSETAVQEGDPRFRHMGSGSGSRVYSGGI